MILASLIAALALSAQPAGPVTENHERRGPVIARLDGAPGESWRACQTACGVNESCRSWTWRAAGPARCELLGSAPAATPWPGAVTGAKTRVISGGVERLDPGSRPPGDIPDVWRGGALPLRTDRLDGGPD
ncbi:hypothetical protein FKB34_03590 [Glycocaulis profundi]|nr:hypothetical protein FKB34_03590 [Glycocaulis profundi]